jgi:outer membrane protein TolC
VRPALIRAINAARIARFNLAHQLGEDVSAGSTESALRAVGSLEIVPRSFNLEAALLQASQRRPELAALRKGQQLREEGIRSARSGYFPDVQAFAGHRWRSATFQDDLAADVSGRNAGVQLNWNVFDGWLTAGKVREARSLHSRAVHQLEDATRQVALEVRTAHSSFQEATEVLASQEKVQEQAEEAHRLANVRAEAGAGIQLDVLSAATALTQARTTKLQAQHDYLVALARLERSIGYDVVEAPSSYTTNPDSE